MTYDNSDLPISAVNRTHAVKTRRWVYAGLGTWGQTSNNSRLHDVLSRVELSYQVLFVLYVYITVSLNYLLHDKLSQRNCSIQQKIA